MTKPDWLVENERKKTKKLYVETCDKCDNFGKPIKQVRHKGRELCMLHECDIHPGCFNTKFSLGCSDWVNTSV